MATRLILSCGGCDATATSESFLRREFHSLNGKGYGFGSWKLCDPQEIVPTGWILFDPYTQCTYCPDCAAYLGLVDGTANLLLG